MYIRGIVYYSELYNVLCIGGNFIINKYLAKKEETYYIQRTEADYSVLLYYTILLFVEFFVLQSHWAIDIK